MGGMRTTFVMKAGHCPMTRVECVIAGAKHVPSRPLRAREKDGKRESDHHSYTQTPLSQQVQQALRVSRGSLDEGPVLLTETVWIVQLSNYCMLYGAG
ncbi:hypothetical protein AOLI_G00303040 [Acnodon oligacanthus]